MGFSEETDRNEEIKKVFQAQVFLVSETNQANKQRFVSSKTIQLNLLDQWKVEMK